MRLHLLPNLRAGIVFWASALTLFNAAYAQEPVYQLSRYSGAEHANVDGPLSTARFSAPAGLAFDRTGNLYVADSGNHTVRKISPAGIVSTLAGNPGKPGFQDGIGAGALFTEPGLIAVDGSQNVYVATREGWAVQKITPSGLVTTVFTGSTELGGLLTSLAADSSGNLYVGLRWPYGLVLKRTPAGALSLYVGNVYGETGTALTRELSQPLITTDASDNFYLVNYGDLVKIPATGGTPVEASSNLSETAVTVDSNQNVYVADDHTHALYKVAPTGEISFLAGGRYGYLDATGAEAQFTRTSGLAVDASGNLFAAEPYFDVIRKITPAGVVTTFAGQPVRSADGPAGTALFQNPDDVAFDATGNLFVTDTGNGSVRKIGPDGAATTFAGGFRQPTGIAVDGSGTIYVADTYDCTIRRISSSGIVTAFVGTAGSSGHVNGTGAAARFTKPGRMAIDGAGNIYVADNRTIRKITPAATVTTLAGSPGQVGYDDGVGEAARFGTITGLVVDRSGTIYVADDVSTVRRVSPAGVVTTLAGKGGADGLADGIGSAAQFRNLQDVGVDLAGNVYASMAGAIRKITPDGEVTTLAKGEAYYYAAGITVDDGGNIYIADRGQDIIRKLSLVSSAPNMEIEPHSVVATIGSRLALVASGAQESTFQWQVNGADLPGETRGTLMIDHVQPVNAGLYTVAATSAGVKTPDKVAIVGVHTTGKVEGSGSEISPDVRHPNGKIFDQVLLTGAAEAITADYSPDPARNQMTRTSFIDLDDDIVQVEFSGPGTLSLVLDGFTGPVTPAKYNQPGVEYMKGHAGIVITGADERTNVSVFSVGRATAVNRALFKEGVNYDGIADIAFIAIQSTNGKFGGVRTANTNYFAHRGYTGIYAPGVEFTGPVYVGDVSAFDSAMPVIVLGSADDVRITGGDAHQDNRQPVQVSGIAKLRFTGGGDSHGNVLAAQVNRAVLIQRGQDVTEQIVVNP